MKLTRKTQTGPRRARGLAGVVVLAAAMLVTVRYSSATTVSNAFELDENATEAGTAGQAPEDWESLIGAASNAAVDVGGGITRIAQTQVPVPDPEATDTTYFKGGGSKDERDINETTGPDWGYGSTDVAPDKDSILNAAAVAYRVPDVAGGDSNSDPDLVINFTADRYSSSGDAVIGFWFFKQTIGLEAGTDEFTGTHTVGDLLIVSDFSQGGDVSTIRVYKWIGGKNPIQLVGATDVVGSPLPGGNVVDCADAPHNPFVCATENDSPETAEWPFIPKANEGTPGTYSQGMFYEGGVNISAVLPGGNECFASFMAQSRSSTSTTAQLKDFVLGDFPICAPKTQLTASPSSASPEIAVVGDSVTFTFSENNNGNVPLTSPRVTTTDNNCVPGTAENIPGVLDTNGKNVGDTDGDGVLDVAETWQFRCSFSQSSVVDYSFDAIGHGIDPAGRDTTFCETSSETQVCIAAEKATARAVWIQPGTDLTVSAAPTLAKQGDTVTYTITEQNDGSAPAGFSASLALSSVAVDSSIQECDDSLSGPVKTGGDQDALLEPGETWTYTCTVTAPATTFTNTMTGTGVVLAGTSHQRTVTGGTGCTTSSTVFCDAEEQASASVTVINPDTELTVTASAVITYTFKERNPSNDPNDALVPPTPTSRESVITTDTSFCNVSGVAYQSGDTGNDKILGAGETWVFTCQGSLAGPDADTGSASTGAVVARGHGTDATGDDVTWCANPGSPPANTDCDQDERDRVKVDITYYPRGSD